jgi:hypothetical protein
MSFSSDAFGGSAAKVVRRRDAGTLFADIRRREQSPNGPLEEEIVTSDPESNACPYCGKSMEEGFLVGRAWLNWAKRPSAALILNELRQERLSSARALGLFQASMPARRCPLCQVGIFRY